MKRIVVIGNGKMAIECLKVMKEHKNAHVLLVISSPKDISLMFLKKYCRSEDLVLELSNNINSLDIAERIIGIKPEIIFNINSFQIIGRKLISIPTDGIINFHNGPLPKYRGVNVCSWAILNREKDYGVTWHYVEEAVDSGDIVAQKTFKLSEHETACSLILRCIDEGISLFKESLTSILEGDVKRVKQNSNISTHYKGREVPCDGVINFEWNYEEFYSFIRCLDFHPIPNSLTYPKASLNSIDLYVQKIANGNRESSETNRCGQVVGISESGVDVKIGDSIITIVKVLNENLKPIKITEFVQYYNVNIGNQMQHLNASDK